MVMAGVLGIYGLITAVIINGKMDAASYSAYSGYAHLGAGLTVGMSSLAAGLAIGIVGDAGVRANAQQPRLFVGAETWNRYLEHPRACFIPILEGKQWTMPYFSSTIGVKCVLGLGSLLRDDPDPDLRRGSGLVWPHRGLSGGVDGGRQRQRPLHALRLRFCAPDATKTA